MPPRIKKPTLFYVEDSELFGNEFQSHARDWTYEWIETAEAAMTRLVTFCRGDVLVLDMAFGSDRYKGLEVLTWANEHKSDILDATLVFTAWDDEDTRTALKARGLGQVLVVGKSSDIADVMRMIEDLVAERSGP